MLRILFDFQFENIRRNSVSRQIVWPVLLPSAVRGRYRRMETPSPYGGRGFCHSAALVSTDYLAAFHKLQPDLYKRDCHSRTPTYQSPVLPIQLHLRQRPRGNNSTQCRGGCTLSLPYSGWTLNMRENERINLIKSIYFIRLDFSLLIVFFSLTVY